MPANLDRYRPFLKDFGLDEAQETALIHSLWNILESHADSAFGLHPAQQVPAVKADFDSPGKPDRVGSSHQIATQTFTQAAGHTRHRKDTTHEGD